MKRLIMDIIASDDRITIGQAPFSVSNSGSFAKKCNVHSSDSVLLVYKTFILTDKGISTPDWYIPWKRFLNFTIESRSNKFIVFSGKNKYEIKVSHDFDLVMDLFRKIRTALEAKIAVEPLFTFDFKGVIMPIIFGNEPLSRLIYSNSIENPAKFADQLDVHYGEEILLSYDTTTIGNSKVGIILTERGIYQRQSFSEATFLSWESFATAVSGELISENEFKLVLANGSVYNIMIYNNGEEISYLFTELYAALQSAYNI